ncbi:MAG TPA: beta-hydroxyacyl-ACP dehydratase [Burkholderiaceae bacterium]|nr:beta-hydroxyacyl-ACP dehydratase [Burkholderiaceae bacterium]
MYPPVEELLAHRGNMLLIDRVLAREGNTIRALALADASAWYAEADGAMPAWIGIELMAQAVAALVGLVARESHQPPKQGMLLGTREYRSSRPAFPAGATLTVVASEVFKEDNGLAAFDATIELDGEVVAQATLKVYEPADFMAALAQET